MTDIAIKVENMSKRYRIGLAEKRSDTLVDTIYDFMRRPLKNFSDLRRLSQFQEEHETDDILWALKDVSFEVKKGEVFGIIGRNGSGKSTLLKILSRITEPTQGQAIIKGRVASLLEVGTGFHPDLTGRENIYLNGTIIGMDRTEVGSKLDEIIAFAEIDKFIDTPIKRYSSGMQVRLAFAVAAHLEPEILILDEVLAVGDAKFAQKSLGKMEEIGRQGRTVLMVSHSMDSIKNLCHKAILLNDGKVEAMGSPNDVIKQYLPPPPRPTSEVIWHDLATAPGNDRVRLYAVRILQDGIEGSAANVDITKEVRIQIAYWNLQEGTPLYTAIHIFHEEDNSYVLATSNHKFVSLTEDSWCGHPHQVGLFQSVCSIPSNFLNQASYNITR
jgi:lipopolysaccharide transport system ATP-binding protein